MSKYYLAVPVGERLPEENAQVCFITQNGKPYSGVWKFPRIWQKPNMNDSWDFNFFSHWLEPREGVLLQTEELDGLCKMAFNQGIANAVYREGSKEYMSFENWIEENLTPANQK